MDKELFVVAKPMEKIQHRKGTTFVGIERWRKDDAVWHRARQDLARNGIAFDATSRPCRPQYKQHTH
jgi:hypothetical protein